MAVMDYHFKCTLKGLAYGRQIVNTFWYGAHTLLAVPPAEIAVMAGQIKVKFMTVCWPAMQPVLHQAYALSSFDVEVFDERFEKVTASPLTFVITGNGTGQGTMDGVAAVVNLAYALTRPFTDDVPGGGYVENYLKRAYNAIGPVGGDFFSDSGYIEAGKMATVNAMGAALSAILTDDATSTEYRPERCAVRYSRLGALVRAAFSIVTGFKYRTPARFRRSRLQK